MNLDEVIGSSHITYQYALNAIMSLRQCTLISSHVSVLIGVSQFITHTVRSIPKLKAQKRGYDTLWLCIYQVVRSSRYIIAVQTQSIYITPNHAHHYEVMIVSHWGISYHYSYISFLAQTPAPNTSPHQPQPNPKPSPTKQPSTTSNPQEQTSTGEINPFRRSYEPERPTSRALIHQ